MLECNLYTSFALFTSLNIDVLHLIIVIYLCLIFVGAIILIDVKIELQDYVWGWLFSWRNYEHQKNFIDKAWARVVNYGPAVFNLTCFVFLVIFVITNLIF